MMNPAHAQMLQDIRSMVDRSGVQDFLDPYPFRDRPSHMYRCYCWAKRILPCRPEADAELTLVSTLFHDIGVIATTREKPKADHDLLGGPIARDYLLQNGYAPAFADRVAALVEHIRLHEDDELDGRVRVLHPLARLVLHDERGALGILWDAMAEGAKPLQTYEGTLERLKMRKLYRRPERNPLVTERGRAFWAEKQRLHMDFVLALERDLGLTDE